MHVSILYAHVCIHVCILKACATTPGCKCLITLIIFLQFLGGRGRWIPVSLRPHSKFHDTQGDLTQQNKSQREGETENMQTKIGPWDTSQS